jgi:hypothetical protein
MALFNILVMWDGIPVDEHGIIHLTTFAVFEEGLQHGAPYGTSLVSRHTSSQQGVPCEFRGV